jgi:CheY-like chemotaxis protein
MLDHNAQILVVDDSTSIRNMVVTILTKKMGIPENNIVQAVNGSDAFKEMTKKRFDLVFTDIEMQPVDGFELTAMIRRYKQFCTTPIILASATPYTDEEAQLKGVDAFCWKNGILKNLGPAIERSIEHAEQHVAERLAAAVDFPPKETPEQAPQPSAP